MCYCIHSRFLQNILMSDYENPINLTSSRIALSAIRRYVEFWPSLDDCNSYGGLSENTFTCARQDFSFTLTQLKRANTTRPSQRRTWFWTPIVINKTWHYRTLAKWAATHIALARLFPFVKFFIFLFLFFLRANITYWPDRSRVNSF